MIALARPDIAVTLVESNHKKTAFLEAVRREIPLPNLVVKSVRIESLSPPAADVATSRATWDLTEWLTSAPHSSAREARSSAWKARKNTRFPPVLNDTLTPSARAAGRSSAMFHVKRRRHGRHVAHAWPSPRSLRFP